MNKFKNLISDTCIFAVGNFFIKIIYFILMPIYTLALTTSEFGLADLLNNTLQLIIPILTLSISDALFRFLLDNDKDKRSLLSNAIFILFISYIFCLIIYFICDFFYNFEKYWLLFFLWYIVDSLKILFAQYTRAEKKIWVFSINGIIGALILLLSTYICVYKLKQGINGYLIAFILADIASILFLISAVNILKNVRFTHLNRKLLLEMLLYSLPLIPNMLSWWFTNISSRYIIAGVCGLSIAGLFSSASKLPALLNIFTSIFQQSWQIASVKEYQESKESQFFSSVFSKYSLVCLIMYSLLVLLVPYVSKIVLQGEFYSAWIYSPLLLFSSLLGCFSTFLGTFYSVVKDNIKAMKSTLYGAIVNIIICLCLIPLLGIIGALIANSISYFIIVIIRIKDTQKYIYFPFNKFRLISCLFMCLLQAIVFMISIKLGIVVSVITICLICFEYRYDLNILYSILSTKFAKK